MAAPSTHGASHTEIRERKIVIEYTDEGRVGYGGGVPKQAAFRTVVGDEDGHGKNYSLIAARRNGQGGARI